MTLMVSVPPSNEVITLEAFIEEVERHVDPYEPKSFRQAAPALAALARNTQFAAQILCDRLKNWDSRDAIHGYDQEAIILHQGPNYAIRMLAWRPPDTDTEEQAHRLRLAPYGFCHNHTFTLLTVGYLGPGYRTEIYQAHVNELIGYAGESVPLEFVEETHLSQGQIMLYHPWCHFHRQAQPEALSFSLNLIAPDPRTHFRDQWIVDTECRKIEDLDGQGVATKDTLRALIAELETPESLINVLEMLAKTHPEPEMRDFAYEIWAGISSAEYEIIWRQALHDASFRVRTLARMALEDKLPENR